MNKLHIKFQKVINHVIHCINLSTDLDMSAVILFHKKDQQPKTVQVNNCSNLYLSP